MPTTPYLTDPDRLAAIEATELLDTPPEECFDRYTRMAQELLGVEMAIVSLVMEDRQFYKSSLGLMEPLASERGSPISVSLCKIGVERRELLAISDGPNDPEFSDHVAITGLKIKSYLGIPIFDENDHALGTLCVLNMETREWSNTDIENLTTLASAVRNEILLRKVAIQRQHAKTEHELLGRILETSVAAVVVLNTAGTIVFSNKTAEKTLGLKSSAIKGRTYDDPEWRSTTLEGETLSDGAHPFSIVLSTGRSVHNIEHAIEWPDGTRRILSVSGSPLRSDDDEITNLVFLITDITESFEASRNLEKVSAQFGQIFRFAHEITVLCRRDDGVIEEVSEGFLKTLKIDRKSCLGKRLDQVSIGFSKDVVGTLYKVGSAQVSEEIELKLEAQDAQFRLVLVRSQAIEVGAQKFLRITGQDITDQRAADQRRIALEAQLRDAQRKEMLGQLAGGLAHDFNNILTAIIGNAELTSTKLERDHPAQKSVQTIKKAGQRAVVQVRQILDLGHRELSPKAAINIAGVVQECVDLFRSQISSAIEVKVETSSDPVFVIAGSSPIHQILMNLLTNAGHAVGNRGNIVVRIDPRTEDSKESLSFDDPVVIEVEDDGSGIDPVNVKLVFDAFFTTKQLGVGSGIGLTLARTIARSFEGDLSVSSELGQGSVFRLRLPRLPAADRTPDSKTRDIFGRHKGQPKARILLVDDDDEVLFTSCLMLEQLGHKVTSTSDSMAALESLTSPESDYNLLVTDNLMPKLSGIELIQQLREKGIMTPAVLISGYGTARTQIEKLGAHHAVFVAKPYSMEEISSAIQSVLAE